MHLLETELYSRSDLEIARIGPLAMNRGRFSRQQMALFVGVTNFLDNMCLGLIHSFVVQALAASWLGQSEEFAQGHCKTDAKQITNTVTVLMTMRHEDGEK